MSKIVKGTIVKDIDCGSKGNRGRYLVFTEDEQTHLEKSEGIWCTNRLSHFSTDNPAGSYGNFFPMHEKTRVLVKINDDLESGEIIGILCDQEASNGVVPLETPFYEQNQITQVFKTLNNANQMVIIENATKNPNSMHIYFNSSIPGKEFGGDTDPITFPKTNIRSRIIFDESGLHIGLANNLNISINENCDIAINGYSRQKITGDSDIHILSNSTVTIDGDINIHVLGNAFITSDSETHIKSKGNINIDSDANINLNCQVSVPAIDAIDSLGYENSPGESKEINTDRSKDIARANKTWGSSKH